VNRLTLFGGIALDAESGPITGRAAQRHRVALLALLSTTRRLHRSRDQLITFLWPDANAERGRKLLSDSIYRVNQALGGDAVVGAREDIRLNRAQLGTDVADLEAAMDVRDWQRVAELYAGPFLDGFFLPGASEFDQWIEVERARYVRAAGKAIETLAVEARDAGRTTDALDWWQRLSSLVPDDSRIAMELMRALEERAQPVRCNSIAVLPFNDLTDSDSNAHLADGVSEELMYILTRTPGLRVASRTSAFAYRSLQLDVREVARRLRVAWILEGSVRRSGRMLRFAAQLTDASNGYQVWSESFDRATSAADWTPADVASAIVRRLALAMEGRFAVNREGGILTRERTAGHCTEHTDTSSLDDDRQVAASVVHSIAHADVH
jgi:TolB-like protein